MPFCWSNLPRQLCQLHSYHSTRHSPHLVTAPEIPQNYYAASQRCVVCRSVTTVSLATRAQQSLRWATVPEQMGRGGLLYPFPWVEIGPNYNTMSPGPRPTSVRNGILIHPTIWPQYTNVTDRRRVMTYSCLHGQAPQYLLDFCQPVSDVASRRHLRSAGRRLLNVPHQRRSTFARRAFSVAGPLVWNSLPDYLRDPAVSRDTFCKHLKTLLSAVY